MAYNHELGNIQIFFGKVHAVHDADKWICRCQIKIPGITDEIENPDMLPWYFPWYGREYLPEIDDTVPVLVFDGNFTTAFYGRKINLEDAGIDEGDYDNYLEIFKRNCDGNDVQLTYKTSKGIEIFNGTEDGSTGSKLHLELDMYTIWCQGNFIQVKEDNIKIGSGEREFTFNSETTRDLIEQMIKDMKKLHDDVYNIFDKVQQAASNPYTIGIKAAIMATNPKYKIDNTQVYNTNSQNVVKDKTISKMVEINK